MTDVLNTALPYDPLDLPHMLRLPGTAPLGDLPWLLRDEAFAGQMRLRDRLVSERPAEVTALVPGAGPAVAELLSTVLDRLAQDPGYRIAPDTVTRPDEVAVPRSLPPLVQLARLVQEDLFVLQPDGRGEHAVTAGTLLFPAHWALSEKIGKPLTLVHRIVSPYDTEVARRVQRMFDAIRVGAPIWRFNLHGQGTDALFDPQTEADPKPRWTVPVPFLRSERQTFLRLPGTGAVVFGIHTFLMPRDRLSPALCDHIDAKVARAGR